jgi:hypothetical protein
MKKLKLYEEFIQSQIQIEDDIELSDKTIDDVLDDDFFSDIEQEEELLNQDKNGVYNIKNWKYY